MDIIDAARNINKSHEEDVLNKLYTPWGETLDDQHVLTEYPRPQFQRANYSILNGYWHYAFTGADLAEGCFPEAFEGKILVPFSPESLLSGVGRQLKPGEYLWYERTFDVTLEDLAAGRLLLHFGAVDQTAWIYVNHQEACMHHGGYLPFECDITPFLHEGGNLLSVRVRDVSDTSYHARGKQTLKRGGMFYTAQSGIWQTVWTEWVPNHYIARLRITPDLDSASVFLQVSSNGKETLCVGIFAGAEEVYSCSFDAASGDREDSCQMELRADIPLLYPWTPEHPFLYTLKLTYGEDAVESYFALRCFTVEPDARGIARFCLNHEPLFLHGVLDQGYWPDGLYTAPSDEAFVYDITTMKKLGFNMIRKHIKIEAARWYYHCDRLGMIVWQDMVSGGLRYSMPLVCYLPTLFPGIAGRLHDGNYKLFGRHLEAGRTEWSRECEETVEYLYNCPSLAVWVPFNEGWGQFDAHDAVKRIKALDQTRPVDQTSGWFDQGGGDFKSVHNYFRRLKVIKDPRAFVLSEYGGYACHIDGHSSVARIYGYRKFSSVKAFTEAYHQLMKQELFPLIQKGLSGAVYTQVSDVEEEVNGILTYDRKICKLEEGAR